MRSAATVRRRIGNIAKSAMRRPSRYFMASGLGYSRAALALAAASSISSRPRAYSCLAGDQMMLPWFRLALAADALGDGHQPRPVAARTDVSERLTKMMEFDGNAESLHDGCRNAT